LDSRWYNWIFSLT